MRRAGPRGSLVVLLLALFLPAPRVEAGDLTFTDPTPGALVMPGIGRHDAREAVNPLEFPWRAIGRVQNALGGRCTGFVVAPTLVLTAAHCLYRARTRLIVQPRLIHFLLAADHGGATAIGLVADFAVAPSYDPFHESDTAGSDWAVLRLTAPLHMVGRALRLAGNVPPPGTQAALGGYSKDHIEIIEADIHCIITQQILDAHRQPLLTHSCQGTEGTSGAPLLMRTANGEWLVAGIQIGAVVNHAGGIAVPATQISLAIAPAP